MRRGAIIVGLCALAFAGQAAAFGTVRFLGQNAEHERITRLALQCTPTSPAHCISPRTLDELAGRSGTFGAVGHPDNPRSGLMSDAKAHCDGGDWLPAAGYPRSRAQAQAALEACRAGMIANLDKAVAEGAGLLDETGKVNPKQIRLDCDFGDPKESAKCKVLEAFGATLHAAQDFYSHSNWTDRPRPGATGIANPPGLGGAGPAPWLSLRGSPAFPPGLVSGCYEGFPEAAYCKGRVRHETLNKDTGDIEPGIGQGSTGRGEVNDNFRRAVEAAVADTEDKWLLLRERLVGRYGAEKGGRMVCALQKDVPQKQCA